MITYSNYARLQNINKILKIVVIVIAINIYHRACLAGDGDTE